VLPHAQVISEKTAHNHHARPPRSQPVIPGFLGLYQSFYIPPLEVSILQLIAKRALENMKSFFIMVIPKHFFEF
jgi:hypothetical protein